MEFGGRDGIRTRINGATWALPQAKPAVGNARQLQPVIGAANLHPQPCRQTYFKPNGSIRPTCFYTDYLAVVNILGSGAPFCASAPVWD